MNTYKIKVLTTDKRNAGTDANVFIELIGTDGNSGFNFFHLKKLNTFSLQFI
jgi:hypothetical protein